ncbi:MAG: hypothetical protein D3910_14820 [Candidatus Electrothrix sp. ATG2]|nr:hypothetical protein [Candidatus Electrothrix sp. ATG2]
MTVARTDTSNFFLKTRIKGCVTEVKHIKLNDKQGFFRSFVTVPALDKYTHPATYLVNASIPLAPEGWDVDVICLVRSVNIPERYSIQLWFDESSDSPDNG